MQIVLIFLLRFRDICLSDFCLNPNMIRVNSISFVGLTPFKKLDLKRKTSCSNIQKRCHHYSSSPQSSLRTVIWLDRSFNGLPISILPCLTISHPLFSGAVQIPCYISESSCVVFLLSSSLFFILSGVFVLK